MTTRLPVARSWPWTRSPAFTLFRSALMHRRRALAVRRAEAVRAGVAAAEDDDPLAGRAQLALDPIAGVHLVLLRQELHREVNAPEIASRDGQVARLCRATGEHDGVECAPQLLAGHVDPDVHRRPERD